MPFMFVSKYEKKHRLESFREKTIQEIQMKNKCSREFAVRYYDYLQHVIGHNTFKLSSCLLYTFGAYKLIQSCSKDIPLMSKSFVKVPILAGGFWLGKVLYEKLISHYLNPWDMDVSHIWTVDLKKKYGVTDDVEASEVPLTPFERMKKETIENMNSLNIEGDKVYKRVSKDRNDFYYMFGKVRNLENIIYINEEEIKKCKNPIELQMKIDSVKPTLNTHGDINKAVEDLHKKIEEYKYTFENSRNFRSIKDKFLGLPFMLGRHQQYPTPVRGTWQFDVYEKMFGEAYDTNAGLPDNEEKINKFNYHRFLHPSVISKYDTTSEDFDMLIRKMNTESMTLKEERASRKQYFCKNVLPILNLSDDKVKGYDFANFVMDKMRSDGYGDYLYDQYSGQKEEMLFRTAEEAKYVDKNQPFVERAMYANIDTQKIGIRAQELNSLLENPTAAKKMRKALEVSFPYYEPVRHIDTLRMEANTTNYYNTIIDREIDTTDPEFKFEDLHAAQYDKGEGGDNPEEEALTSHHVNFERNGVDLNNNPYGVDGLNYFSYYPMIDWNDYQPDRSAFVSFISPKKDRFRMFSNLNFSTLNSMFFRGFNSFEFQDKIGYVVPYIDYKNEDLKSRVLFRSNYHRFIDNSRMRDSDKVKLEFLESKAMEDTYHPSDDVTEEELDQALFESTYNKPIFESDELRSLNKRNKKELEHIFKVVEFEASEVWNDPNITKQFDHEKPLTDKAQLLDPLVNLYSEVEQPNRMRNYIQKWRSGAEMRFKLPYYPETKAPSKTFNYA